MKRQASFDFASNDDYIDDDDNYCSSHASVNAACGQPTQQLSNFKSNKKLCVRNRIGNFILGPKLNGLSSTSKITHYLCRKDKSDYFFILKVLVNNVNQYDSKVLNGKMLLQNEHTILSMLQNDDGIIHHHGLFKEVNCINNEMEKSEKLCLVLDCYVRHEYDNKHYYTNLQHYIIKQKCLNEREALTLFYKLFKIIQCIHDKNIVHRDLKLGNIIYDLQTLNVYLINFSLSRHLIDTNELLTENIGSPAYISPEILNNQSYCGKSSDIWSLGIVLYTILFGNFPFYDPSPEKLFEKIKLANYTFPNHVNVSDNTKRLLKNILHIDPIKRFNAAQVIDSIMSIVSSHVWKPLLIDCNNNENVHIVPQFSQDSEDKKQNDDYKFQTDLILNLRNLSTNENLNTTAATKAATTSRGKRKNNLYVYRTSATKSKFNFSNSKPLVATSIAMPAIQRYPLQMFNEVNLDDDVTKFITEFDDLDNSM